MPIHMHHSSVSSRTIHGMHSALCNLEPFWRRDGGKRGKHLMACANCAIMSRASSMGFMSSSVGTSNSYTVSSTDVYAFWHAPKGHPKASRRFTSWWDSYFSVALNALHASCHTAVESHSALTPLSAARWNVSNEEAWKQLPSCCTTDGTSPAELGCPDLPLALL